MTLINEGNEMRTKIARFVITFALKRIVKYLLAHPDAIPGEVDDRVLPILAKFLGV
ncbi:hypothetical protein SEA_QOBBIT_10 [Mycobacterium phage Qobbit]|nr:hypothetical protein SEA_QOBBIT_10 [Mycobacterium phage Qobbit]